MLAHVTLCQVFHNPGDVAVNCVYAFPMDPHAAVNRVLVTADDRVLEGRVVEKEEAREEFDAAVQRGDRAYLVEESEVRCDTFFAKGSETGTSNDDSTGTR